jgi:hypothetical protein
MPGFTTDRAVLKAKYSFYAALVFFLIANPETYKIIQRILGGFITVVDVGGCPTANGFFLHTALFFLAMWGLMMFPTE